MGKSIIIDEGISYTRVAIMEDDKLSNLLLENNFNKQIYGDIYQGRISNIVKGIKAAFIEIGHEKKAFLHFRDIPKGYMAKLKNNQRIMVQVIKEGQGNKGPKVTASISLTGKYFVLLPFEDVIGISRKIKSDEERERLRDIVRESNPRSYGVIVRTGASKVSEECLRKELKVLIKKWETIKVKGSSVATGTVLYKEPSLPVKTIREFANHDIKEVVSNTNYNEKSLDTKFRLVDSTSNLFGAYGIDREIEKALKKRVWLKSGANIVIEKTEAMNVIDVNSAKSTEYRKKDKMLLKINLEAAKESARQIRIRNLSGIIIIDFIGMDNKDQQQILVDKLQYYLNKDKIKSKVYPITELGLVQITRQRSRPSLMEEITRDCPCCKSRNTHISYDYLLVEVEKDIREITRESIHRDLIIKADNDFVEHISNKVNLNYKFKERYGANITLCADKQIKKGKYEIKLKS